MLAAAIATAVTAAPATASIVAIPVGASVRAMIAGTVPAVARPMMPIVVVSVVIPHGNLLESGDMPRGIIGRGWSGSQTSGAGSMNQKRKKATRRPPFRV